MEAKMGVGATHSREAEEAAKTKTTPPSPGSFPAAPTTKSSVTCHTHQHFIYTHRHTQTATYNFPKCLLTK